MPANLENAAVATWLEKPVFVPIPKKGNTKECSNYRTIALILHGNMVTLKILQDRLQQYMNWGLADVQAGFKKGRGFTCIHGWFMSMYDKNHYNIVKRKKKKKGRGTRDQTASILWITEKAGEFQKNIYFCFIAYTKVFDCMDHNKLWKILKEIRITGHLTYLLRSLYTGQEATGRTGHATMDWFKIGKKYVKAIYCHPAYLTYMLSTSCEMLGWMNHKLESRWLEEISATQIMQMIPL